MITLVIGIETEAGLTKWLNQSENDFILSSYCEIYVGL